jgi:prepilin-type N-terminal cleavage/methylation domain-containing protein
MTFSLWYNVPMIHTKIKMNASYSGFTLVELIVVIVVIGILSGLVIGGLNRYLMTTRDAQREASAQVIAESLEKYYNGNGEYVSCADLATGGTAIQDRLPDLQESSLKTPSAPSGTVSSVTCAAPSGTTDVFAFVGDGSPSCAAANGNCLGWTISYRSEIDNVWKEVNSRRGISLATSRKPVVTVNNAGTNGFSLTWTETDNASGYELQYGTSSTFANATPVTTTSQSHALANLPNDTTYYFRVKGTNGLASSAWSDRVSGATTGPTPSAPIAFSMGSNRTAWNSVTWTSGAACAANGTLQNEWNLNGGVSYSGSSSRSDGIGWGSQLTMSVRARCTNGPRSSGWTSANNNSHSHSLWNPGMNPHIWGGERTAVWDSLYCPQFTTSWYIDGWVQKASGGYDLNWSGGGGQPGWWESNHASPGYKAWWYDGAAWGSGSVQGSLHCYGPWGDRETGWITSGF